jgi:hypothetical protein
VHVPGLNDIGIVDVAIGSTHGGGLYITKKINPEPLTLCAVLLNQGGAVYTWGLSKCVNEIAFLQLFFGSFDGRYGSLGAGEGVMEAAAPRKAGVSHT